MLARFRFTGCILIGSIVLASASDSFAGRFSQFMDKAQEPPHAEVVAATYFGSESHERFETAAALSDGQVVAFGNAWGPAFPEQPQPAVLGRGQRHDVSPYEDEDSDNDLDMANPNIAGFIVRYSEDLQSIEGVTRFDWGVGTIEHGLVTEDDGIIIAGRATERMARTVTQTVAPIPHPDGDEASSTYEYQGVDVSNDAYLARLNADATRVEWLLILDNHGRVRGMWMDHNGNIVLDAEGVYRIRPDGRSVDNLEDMSGGGMHGVSPTDGTILRGGHNNPGTGREPWWRPYVNVFDAEGDHIAEIYGWSGGLVGLDQFRLVSDSYVRGGTFDHDGNMIVLGSSDGGNSVYSRSPIDLTDSDIPNNYGMSVWGMNIGQASYLVRIDPEDFEVLNRSVWAVYLPWENRPNSVWIHHAAALKDGPVIFAGRAASSLSLTPNAFMAYDDEDDGYGGGYVAIFNENFDHLLFSSYTPGAEVQGVAAVGDRRAAVLTKAGKANNHDDKMPGINAVQPQRRGERFDAHIAVFETPQEQE